MEDIKLIKGDCLVEMQNIPDNSIDCIICDLPYGTTRCKWDIVIPFDKLWEQYERIIKDNGNIILFGSEPFSSYLRLSDIKMFKYDLIWEKNKSTGFLNAKKQPLNNYEIISIFYNKKPTYNPQMTQADRIYKRGFVKRDKESNRQQSDCYGEQKSFFQIDNGLRYPKRIIYFNNNFTNKQLHPTQKSVALIEYLIKTYTNEGDLILDNTAGSMTTAIAAINTNRKCICIEKDDKYFEIGSERVRKHLENKQLNLF